jgi:hypothetical protein
MIKLFENFQGDDIWRSLQQAKIEVDKLTFQVRETIEKLLSFPDLEHDGVELKFRFLVQVEEENYNDSITVYTQSVEGFDLEEEEFLVESEKYTISELIDWMPNLSELIFAAQTIYRAVEETYGYQKYLIEKGKEHQLDMNKLHEDIMEEYPYLKGGKRTGIL